MTVVQPSMWAITARRSSAYRFGSEALSAFPAGRASSVLQQQICPVGQDYRGKGATIDPVDGRVNRIDSIIGF